MRSLITALICLLYSSSHAAVVLIHTNTFTTNAYDFSASLSGGILYYDVASGKFVTTKAIYTNGIVYEPTIGFLSVFHTNTTGDILLNLQEGGSAGPSIQGYAGRFVVANTNLSLEAIGPYSIRLMINSSNALEVVPGAISLSGQTNLIADSGAALTYNGVPIGGGAALWTSAGGVLSPSPAVDVVSITSQLADNATNVALVVDTDIYWSASGANLAAIANAHTNVLTVNTLGGIMAGPSTRNYWGALSSEAFVSVHDIAKGDPDYNELYIEATDTFNLRDTSFDVGMTTSSGFIAFKHADAIQPSQFYVRVDENGATALRLEESFAGLDQVVLTPAIPGDNFIFNTAVVVPGGNIFRFGNMGTNKVTGDYLGRLSLQGQTNLIGDSGTALTYNGVAIGGGGAPVGTVINSVATAGLLAVDASKTNGIAATLAHMTNALALTGSTTTFLRSDGTQATPPDLNTWGPVGTMVASGMTTAGVVPMTTGTSGTNFVASPMQGTGTNVAFNGGITAYNATFTNTVTARGFVANPDTGYALNSSFTVGIYDDTGSVGTVHIGSAGRIAWTSGVNYFNTVDTFLYRDAAARLQLGIDAASPVSPQIFGVADGVGTDKNGSDFQLSGGRGTGTGDGGDVVITTANTTSTGSSAQAESTRARYVSKFVTLTESSATLLFTVPVANTNQVGLTASVTIYATDGTETQSQTTIITVDAVAKTTVITAAVSPTAAQAGGALSSGTLSTTYTVADAGSNVLNVLANAVSSLTQTTLRAKTVITAINASGTAVITPQ